MFFLLQVCTSVKGEQKRSRTRKGKWHIYLAYILLLSPFFPVFQNFLFKFIEDYILMIAYVLDSRTNSKVIFVRLVLAEIIYFSSLNQPHNSGSNREI